MTTHVYAVISDGVVENVIVATPEFASAFGQANRSQTVRIDHLTPTPGVDWSYSHRRFAPPAPRVDPFAQLFGGEHEPPAAS